MKDCKKLPHLRGAVRRSAAFTLCLAMIGSAAAMPNLFPNAAAADPVIAFPGAVGGGKFATGGRGGEVYHVTNLNDSGAGSFRDAVSKSNRIVVFDVSGTIELKSNILCQGNVTIAGQTAPGGSGITLKNYKLGMSGDNIICRFISSRPGPYASTSSGNDAWGGSNGSNSIIDHCSMGWTTDEQWGLYSKNEYYTVQYSTIGPADSWGGHSKGLHGFGIMLGRGYCTFDHNLIIHCVSRNFRGKVEGTKTADFTNNVIYDWGYQTTYGTIGHLNYVNNTLKAGNSTTGGYHWMYVDSTTKPQNFKVYCDGNRLINKDGSLHAITADNWAGVKVKESIGITVNDLHSNTAFQTVVNGVDVSTALTAEPAEASFEHVVTYAGNGISSEKRTAIDQLCASDARNGTGYCSGTAAYDSSESNLDKYQIQCGITYEYPAAVLQKEIVDTDNDGMPDAWELERGLNPSDPSDTNGDYCGQGYTNIEYYINDLTVDAFPAGTVTPSPTEGYGTPEVLLQGRLVQDLQINDRDNRMDWSLQEGAALGDLLYGDRAVTFATIPDYLSNAEFIRTACDSKFYTEDLATFTAKQDLTLFVALESRVETPGAWLSSYKLTDDTLSYVSGDSAVWYRLYKRSVRAGETVTLGSNNQSAYCVGYLAFALDYEPVATTTETTITTTEETTTSAPSVLRGDVDVNGEVGIADAVMLARYNAEDALVQVTAQGLRNAEMNDDGKLTSDDLVLILQVLAKLISYE